MKKYLDILTKIIIIGAYYILYNKLDKSNTFDSKLYKNVNLVTSIIMFVYLIYDHINLIKIFLFQLAKIKQLLFTSFKEVKDKVPWFQIILMITNTVVSNMISSKNNSLFHISFQDKKNKILSSLKILLIIQIVLFVYDLIKYLFKDHKKENKLMKKLKNITLDEYKLFEKEIKQLYNYYVIIKENPDLYINTFRRIMEINNDLKDANIKLDFDNLDTPDLINLQINNNSNIDLTNILNTYRNIYQDHQKEMDILIKIAKILRNNDNFKNKLTEILEINNTNQLELLFDHVVNYRKAIDSNIIKSESSD